VRGDRRERARAALRATLLAHGIAEPVVDAVMAVPRDRFVPSGEQAVAWDDRAMAIGHDQTISQPTVVAVMTQAAAVGPGDVVLDVGTGSGYQAAVLAACGSEVHSIERIPALAARARHTLAGVAPSVTVHVGDGTKGLPAHAPYDAIVVAAATRAIPPALLEQLRPPRPATGAAPERRGGRLVIPVGEPSWLDCQRLLLVERTAGGYAQRHLLDVLFVPLVADRA
jgi:protein-L-isoaspartate(D-aspartate) O-methyltransferase